MLDSIAIFQQTKSPDTGKPALWAIDRATGKTLAEIEFRAGDAAAALRMLHDLDALDGLLEQAARTGAPLVVGTTGFSAIQQEKLREYAATACVVQAANFSVGIPALQMLLQLLARTLPQGFDAEQVETHHVTKLDRPSGTARTLADAYAALRGGDTVAEDEVAHRDHNSDHDLDDARPEAMAPVSMFLAITRSAAADLRNFLTSMAAPFITSPPGRRSCRRRGGG